MSNFFVDNRTEEAVNSLIDDALNERDIEIINSIKKIRSVNKFPDSEAAQSAFEFACDEIIKLIESEND